MKATAFSSQSATTLADATLTGLVRNAASNNHARHVMAVLPNVRDMWPKLRAFGAVAAKHSQSRSAAIIPRNPPAGLEEDLNRSESACRRRTPQRSRRGVRP